MTVYFGVEKSTWIWMCILLGSISLWNLRSWILRNRKWTAALATKGEYTVDHGEHQEIMDALMIQWLKMKLDEGDPDLQYRRTKDQWMILHPDFDTVIRLTHDGEMIN